MKLARVYESGLVALVWLLGASIFFRASLLSGFNAISGDIGDGKFIIFVHEHWLRVLTGRAPMLETGMFFPAQGTLGYSEAFFLYQIFYAPLRLLGFDPFISYQLTLVFLTFIGFFSLYFLVRIYCRAGMLISITCALLFAFSNANYLKVGHSQFFSVNFIPAILLIILSGFRSFFFKGRSKSLLTLFLGGFLYALVFLTSFYVGWISGILIGIYIIAFLLVDGTRSLKPAIAHMKQTALAVLSMFMGFAIGIIPFLITYLPVIREGRRRSFDEVLLYSGLPLDLINVGLYNFMWGKLLASLPNYPVDRLNHGEFNLAPTPFLFLLTIIFLIFIASRTKKEQRSINKNIYFSLTISALIAAVLPLKFGDTSLWWLLWKFVPGGGAIRAPFRIHIFVNMLMVLALAWSLPAFYRHLSSRLGQILSASLVTGVSALLLLEQVNMAANAHIDRPDEMARLSAITPPPASCDTFYVVSTAKVRPHTYAYQMDAMFVSQIVNIPTVNGYSGLFPERWNLIDLTSPTYELDAYSWLDRHDLLKGACKLDLATMEWSDVTRPAELVVHFGDEIDFSAGGGGVNLLDHGWSAPESWGIWTDGTEAALTFLFDQTPPSSFQLSFEVQAFVTPPHPEQGIEVLVNGELYDRWAFKWGEQDSRRRLDIPAGALDQENRLVLTFRLLNPTSPMNVGLSEDSRTLGLGLRHISVTTPHRRSELHAD